MINGQKVNSVSSPADGVVHPDVDFEQVIRFNKIKLCIICGKQVPRGRRTCGAQMCMHLHLKRVQERSKRGY